MSHANKVNIHFENKLAGVPVKANFNFDYIYFLLNTNDIPVITTSIFEAEYLSFLNSLGFVTNFVYEADEVKNWWVLDEECELTKNLNSKVFVHQLIEENNIANVNGQIISNEKEYRENRGKYNLYRSNYSVSGRGVRKLSEELKPSFPCILGKLRERVLDFGTIYDEGLEGQVYFNLVDSGFCFRGQFFCHSKGKIKDPLLQACIEDSLEKGQLLQKKLHQNFMVKSFQFDSFIYKENGNYELEFCHEINYRRSMGLVFQSLKERQIFKNKFSIVLYLNLNKKISFVSFQREVEKLDLKDSLIPLSPLTKGLAMFVINFESGDDFNKTLDSLCQVVGFKAKKVYNEILEIVFRILEVHEY